MDAIAHGAIAIDAIASDALATDAIAIGAVAIHAPNDRVWATCLFENLIVPAPTSSPTIRPALDRLFVPFVK